MLFRLSLAVIKHFVKGKILSRCQNLFRFEGPFCVCQIFQGKTSIMLDSVFKQANFGLRDSELIKNVFMVQGRWLIEIFGFI